VRNLISWKNLSQVYTSGIPPKVLFSCSDLNGYHPYKLKKERDKRLSMTEVVNEEPRKSLMDRIKEALEKLSNVEDQLKKLRSQPEKDK
jgi:hypothetical protein